MYVPTRGMNQVGTRRIFIGIPILEKDFPKFFSWSKNLHHEAYLGNLGIRWSKPENYHITLCFLGDSDNHPIEGIIDLLSKQTFSCFWLQIQQLGFFMNGKNSNVMWAGIESKEIHPFQKKIQEHMVELGYTKEFKPFKPHITLGRIKQPKATHHYETISTVLDQMRVTQFCLFESIASIQHVQYRVLQTFSCK